MVILFLDFFICCSWRYLLYIFRFRSNFNFSFRPPLAEVIREEFVQRIPSGIFTTNPCRIQYGTKEIVVLREDILTKMCRNAINFPSDDIPQQVCQVLTSLNYKLLNFSCFLVCKNVDIAGTLVSSSWGDLPCLLAIRSCTVSVSLTWCGGRWWSSWRIHSPKYGLRHF